MGWSKTEFQEIENYVNVVIKISYKGSYKHIVGKDADKLEVPETMKEASESIADFLNNKYKIYPPYTLLVNGMPHNRSNKKKGSF